MDGGLLGMDLGMDLYEQWDWQRFREAESMELDEEGGDESMLQAEMGVESGDEADEGKVEESRKKLLPQYDGIIEEADDKKSKHTGLPQYDGPDEEKDENASPLKVGSKDIDARSRQVGFPQYDGPSEGAMSISKTGVEGVDIIPNHDDTVSTSLPDEALGKNDSEDQEQSVALEAAEVNQEENHFDNLLDKNRKTREMYVNDGEHPPADQKKALEAVADKESENSERYNDEAEQRENREAIVAGDGSISDFLGGETVDEDVIKVCGDSTSQETLKEPSIPKSAAIETVSKPESVADVNNSGDINLVEKRINDTIDDPVMRAESTVLEKSHDYTSSEREVATEEAKIAVDEDAGEKKNRPEEAQSNNSNLATAHSDIIEETGNNGNTGTHSEIDRYAVESNTSGFLSNQDLRDLEGKSSSNPTPDQSPVKLTTEGGSSGGILNAVKDTADESTPGTADIDNVPALTYTQTRASSITDQVPVNDSDMEDVELPPLSRTNSPAQRGAEIPDSDAVTASSQQSPQKLTHIEIPLDRRMWDTQNVETPIANAATEEGSEDKETEGLVSSFGRECATSSIDPKKQLNEPKAMEAEILQNVTDNAAKESEASVDALVEFPKKLAEGSSADAEYNMEAESPSAQSFPQKMTNRRGRPPGRKRSGIVNNKLDDEESADKMATLIEADSEKPRSMDSKDMSNASSSVPEKKGPGRTSGRKISALAIEEPATKQGPGSQEVPAIEKTNEVAKQTPTKDPLANKLSPSSPAPEKRKRGRPVRRKISVLSTATGDGDVEDAEREVASMDEESTNLIVGPNSTDRPEQSSPIHPMQEKRKGRPPGRKSSNLSSVKQDVQDLDVLNSVTALAPSENAENLDDPVFDDTVDEMTANSSSPVKRKRGRSASQKFSGSSPRIVDTEEIVKEASRIIPTMVTKNAEMEDATPNQKSPKESVAISSPQVKSKRGRPSYKSSGIVSDGAEVGELPNEASSIPHNEASTQEATTNGRSNEALADSSSERLRKRGRPSNRKVSELTSQKTVIEEAAGENSEDFTAEKTANTSMNESGDVHSANEPADTDSSPVKRKRGMLASRTVSGLSPEKTIVNEASEGTQCMATEKAAIFSINAPVANLKSADEPPPFGTPLPEKTKRGRPGSRKVSQLNPQKIVANEAAEEDPEGIKMQEAIASDINEPPDFNSSSKRKRGRTTDRKPSGVSLEKHDIVEPVKATPNGATAAASEIGMNADINDLDASLSATSSPAKRKGGRPACKASSLSTGKAANESMPTDVNAAGKNTLIEIVDSDEEGGELLDESSPAKKAKLEPRKRGRPSGIKSLNLSTEDTKAGEEDLGEERRTRAKGAENMVVDTQVCNELPLLEKKRRGRPLATKVQRITNSDSEVTEDEKQTSEESKIPGAKNEWPVEAEHDEQENPAIEKKKRGRPALLKNKGKQTAKVSEPANDEDVNLTMKYASSTTASSKGKVSASQVSNSSNNSSSSQRQDAFFAEMKAIKISSILSRNAQLKSEIAQKVEKTQEISQGLEQPARETVKRHIKLLHDYNDIKDVGQGLLGMIADNRGVRVGELYEEFGVNIAD
ncbi:hypothetical protein DSL72_000453 [Monilinia vaccinii-corymbosi]|uniref:Uncharacterized protein n=1 Tax=Monilinia vaccinii-corymbosi TaxID=61207 RepID=A0A8A3NZ00_9HELO|nr:hypothetical protein DSL72_000453 [Monilinia vaccinii-corymbosi]